uniref:RNA binding motif protein 26 n=1 Tax=Leptobrachium leishanense TaxID=445787 RepID=A0A8C5LRE8_9ANUR
MIIEDFEALKDWLTSILEPICDADPSALAKYVLALVKKDKNDGELKAFCIDQLDVFLQRETQGFVDKMFDAISTKSYLPQPASPSSTAIKLETFEHQEIESKKEEVPKEDDSKEKKISRRANHSPQPSSSRHREIRENSRKRSNSDRESSSMQHLFRSGGQEPKPEGDIPQSRLSGSKIQNTKTTTRSRDDRKKDDRSRKREYDRNPTRRDSYRDRYNRRRGRSRSYSRSRSRSWSKERQRDRDRDRSRSRSRTRSRDKESGKPKYDVERTEPADNSYPAGPSVTHMASAHYQVPTLSSTITVITPSHHGSSSTENWPEFHEDQVDHGTYGRTPVPKKRCRDYDEKGFCMRGDMCPFDHGSDPVVVEDVNLPGILPFPAQPPVVDVPPPLGLPPPPSLLTPPPVNLRPPVPPPGPLPPSLPPVTGPPPPLPPLQPAGMDAPPISATSSVPTVVTTGIRHPPPPVAPPSLFSSAITGPIPMFPEQYETDGYNPEAPSMTSTARPMYRHRVHAQRPNLIGLTSGDMDSPPREKPISNNMRIVVDSESRKRNLGTMHSGLPPKKPWFDKSNFNRQSNVGFQKKVQFSNENTKLELRRIPPDLNNISKLNEHFSKFGTLVNLQVAYEGDPEAALIQFASPIEAKKAISSTEAVLNNRFIKMYWHREGQPPQVPSPATPKVGQFTVQPNSLPALKQSVKERLGPVPSSNLEPAEAQSANSESVQNITKVSIKDRLGYIEKNPSPATEKVLSTSTGLTKTVYNPAALKAMQKSLPYPAPVEINEAQKKKQEALKLQQNVRKKKQEILEKHIETQKILISKFEKNKNMKSEDKAEILKTLEMLNNNITKLRDEQKAVSSAGNALKSNRSRAQTQKELLDTELDLYKKVQAGEDVAELRKKYTELQLEAAKRGVLSSSRGRGAHQRGRGMFRGRGRVSRGRGGRGVPRHAVIDHRPRALEITGFTENDREDLLPHFAQFGEIEDYRVDDSSLHAIISFRTRSEAETAAFHGTRFKGQNLKLAWNKPVPNISCMEAEDAEQDEEDFQEDSIVDDSLLQDDDEEEEDNESRSWRR